MCNEMPTFYEHPACQSKAHTCKKEQSSDDFAPHLESFVHLFLGKPFLVGMIIAILVYMSFEDAPVCLSVDKEEGHQEGRK